LAPSTGPPEETVPPIGLGLLEAHLDRTRPLAEWPAVSPVGDLEVKVVTSTAAEYRTASCVPAAAIRHRAGGQSEMFRCTARSQSPPLDGRVRFNGEVSRAAAMLVARQAAAFPPPSASEGGQAGSSVSVGDVGGGELFSCLDARVLYERASVICRETRGTRWGRSHRVAG